MPRGSTGDSSALVGIDGTGGIAADGRGGCTGVGKVVVGVGLTLVS